MRTLNLGILAHVDAGKTSLTERLLHTAGVLDAPGSVDAGTTHTDFLDLERRRGITIQAAVVSFAVGGVTINLLDTPGHPDFIAEVERALGVLDGAVLVVSAVEGVQAQTLVLMRALQRLGIPTLLFVNKIDRVGAREGPLLRAIADRLTPAIVPMGTVRGLGTRGAAFAPFAAGDLDMTAVAEHDDRVLAALVDGERPPWLGRALAAQARRGAVHPVFFGSAATGAGVDALVAGITGLLPAATAPSSDPGTGAGEPPDGTVFKIDRGPAGERVAYVRMVGGVLRVRDRIGGDTVTGIEVFHRGGTERRSCAVGGEIARVRGLGGVRIGSVIGPGPSLSPSRPGGRAGVRAGVRGGVRARARAAGSDGSAGSTGPAHHFAPPTLSTVVESVPALRAALHAALTQLAEQDPLIGLRLDDVHHELHLSLYGEVQKEVVQARLAEDFGVDVTFRESAPICVERVRGTGAAVEEMPRGRSAPRPFLAGVGLRVDAAPVGSGVRFAYEIELGALPPAFMTAIAETVPEALGQGLHGWEVTDCVVTLTHSQYAPRQSHAHQGFSKAMSSVGADFRLLTPLVLMEALRRAGTVVCEPVHAYELEVPADALPAVVPALARLEAPPLGQRAAGSLLVLSGRIRAGEVHALQVQLPELTRGEGVLTTVFDGHSPVRGAPPSRPRTDDNPLHREEYLLRVAARA
jgi:ribosomal protection tetracycline resistance protein